MAVGDMINAECTRLDCTDIFYSSSTVLAGGYRESAISSLDAAFPREHDDCTDEYEYFSDSDLDEEEYSADDKTVATDSDGKQKVDGKGFINLTQPDRGSSESAMVYSEQDTFPVGGSSQQPVYTTGQRGKVVVLSDVALRTYVALIFLWLTQQD